MEIVEKIKNYTTDNLEHLIIILLTATCLGLIVYNVIYQPQPTNYPAINQSETAPPESLETPINIKVDIKGYIVNPGVYEVNYGLNINDLIQLAGGLTRGGTTRNINLSHRLSDQMVIIIHNERQVRTLTVANATTCDSHNLINCNLNNNYSVIEQGPTPGRPNNQPKPPSVPSGPISINNGTKEQLMTLSGIGESRAIAIIEFRNTNGPFLTLEDIMNVSGIGQAIFDNIKAHITL